MSNEKAIKDGNVEEVDCLASEFLRNGSNRTAALKL